MPAGKNGYRGPGSVNLKGRNTWVRQSEAVKAEDAQAKPEEKRPVKVGAYKLVRSPSLVPPQLRNASHAARKIPPTGRNKFKYERPKEGATAAVPDSAPKQPERPQRAAPVKPKAAATARPSQPKRKGNLTWVNPALKTATAAGRVKPGSTLQSKIKTSLLPPRRKVQSTPKVSLRPSKEKWNKYVRPGAEKLPLKAAPIARASSLNSTAASGLRRSPRLTTQQHRSSVAPRTQRATKLLRLGGRLYTLGRRSKGRSLTLQATVPTGSAQSGLRQLSAAAQRTSRQPKPKPAEANVNLPIKRKLAVRKTSLKPSARLKVSKIKYCPVYCHKGQCPRRGRGCPYVHDPTKRAVCTKWLLGRCELGKTCPLQHQRKPELMPACVHFLQARPCRLTHPS